MKRLAALVGVGLLAMAGLAACGDDGGGSSASGSDVVVTDAWARPSPAMSGAAAVYLDVENTGDTDDAIVAAQVDPSVAGSAELHETVAADDSGDMSDMGDDSGGDMGAMGMRPVDSIDVPAGETVTLEPGGLHVMLLDLPQPLAEGDELTLTLTFEQAGDVDVPVTVRSA